MRLFLCLGHNSCGGSIAMSMAVTALSCAVCACGVAPADAQLMFRHRQAWGPAHSRSYRWRHRVPVISYGNRNPLNEKGRAKFPKVLNSGNAMSARGGKRTYSSGVRLSRRRAVETYRVVTAIGVGARKYQASRPRYRVSIPRGPISHAADQPGVARGRSPREERQSQYI
jgi:hypothetical protein